MQNRIKHAKSRWIRLVSLLMIPVFLFSMEIVQIPKAQAAEITRKFLYVAETGNDYTGNGSSESPYRSIKRAADEETAGGNPLETTDESNDETDETINDDNTEGETE